jgi:hypothetical protein
MNRVFTNDRAELRAASRELYVSVSAHSVSRIGPLEDGVRQSALPAWPLSAHLFYAELGAEAFGPY